MAGPKGLAADGTEPPVGIRGRALHKRTCGSWRDLRGVPEPSVMLIWQRVRQTTPHAATATRSKETFRRLGDQGWSPRVTVFTCATVAEPGRLPLGEVLDGSVRKGSHAVGDLGSDRGRGHGRAHGVELLEPERQFGRGLRRDRCHLSFSITVASLGRAITRRFGFQAARCHRGTTTLGAGESRERLRHALPPGTTIPFLLEGPGVARRRSRRSAPSAAPD